MDREERDRAAEVMMEQRISLILSLGLPWHNSLQAAFRFGRAYGLNEAAGIIEEVDRGPKSSVEDR